MVFTLHPHLAADTLPVGDLALCRILLMNDSRYPWLILVPRRPDLREIIDLPAPERGVLIEEIAAGSSCLQAATGAEKLNVGAIGNRVAQLHIHVVARFAHDAVWPDPVWGRGAPVPYGAQAAGGLIAALSTGLGLV